MIGVQSFGISNALTSDLTGTLSKLSVIGFDFIEPFLTLHPYQADVPQCLIALDRLHDVRTAANSCGLQIQSVHVDPFLNNHILSAEELSKGLLMLHDKFSLNEFVISGKFFDKQTAVYWGALLRKTLNLLNGTSCRILYHNHDSETRSVPKGTQQVPAMDFFLEETAGEIPLELDIGWAGMYADELEIFNRYSPYIYILHLKDFVSGSRGLYTCATTTESCFAPVGNGEIKIDKILKLCHALPNFSGNFIIDQNQSTHVIFDDLTTGIITVKKLLKI